VAQINLLKQQDSTSNFGQFLPGLFVKVLTVAVICLFAYYGWLFLKAKKLVNNISAAEKTISDSKTQAATMPGRDELLTRQAQLKELSGLISKHTYMSQLIPALAKVTLKTAIYTSLKSAGDGNMTLSVALPDMNELDKFLQVFDRPEFSKNFNNLRIGSIHKVQSNGRLYYKFDVIMTYNTSLLNYNGSAISK